MAEKILKRMLTRREAALAFGVAPGTLANWMSCGVGPRAYKVRGKKILYRLEDLEIFFQAVPIQTADSITV